MKTKLSFLVALAAMVGPPIVAAQGFIGNDEPTCYSWEGGHKSAGSFHKCGPRWQAAAAKPAPLPAPVVQSPIMMPMAAPVSCAPPPKPVIRKPRPKPQKC